MSDMKNKWMIDAACKGMDTSIFIPDSVHPERSQRALYKEALAVCAGCTVVKECLNYALEIDDQLGVYGGTSPSMRRRLRYEYKHKL